MLHCVHQKLSSCRWSICGLVTDHRNPSRCRRYGIHALPPELLNHFKIAFIKKTNPLTLHIRNLVRLLKLCFVLHQDGVAPLDDPALKPSRRARHTDGREVAANVAPGKLSNAVISFTFSLTETHPPAPNGAALCFDVDVRSASLAMHRRTTPHRIMGLAHAPWSQVY